MKMDIGAQTPTLKDVVESYSALRVEDYQRTYSWQREQIDELLLDLTDCSSSSETHFFGTLILQESEGKTATIVDGQQRLTTVFILIAALRDELLKLESQVIPAANKNQRPTDVVKKAWDFLYPTNDFTVHRFASSRFLRKLMKEYVIAEPAGRPEIPFRDNDGKKVTLDFRKAVRHIRGWADEELDRYPDQSTKLVQINLLLDTILTKFRVLRVVTRDITESLDIFLTLNNRGLPLGPSDLVRGEVMSVLGNGLSDLDQSKLHRQILSEWEGIVEDVQEPETFLRHYLVSTSRKKIQKKKIVKEVSDRIAAVNIEDKRKNAKHFWEELIQASVVYGQILKPKMGGDSQYHIELLEGLAKSHRIFLLTVLALEIDEQDRAELIRLTMILSYRYVMAGLNAQKMEDFLQDQSANLREEIGVAAVVKDLKDKINGIELNVERYLINEGDSSFAGRALLHAVNRSIIKGAIPVPLQNSSSHLEHIAPQSENDEWAIALFGNDVEARKDYDLVIGSIGNLTLLDQGLNQSAQRKPFFEKHAYYKTSSFDISRDLIELPSWTANNVTQRTKWLVECFEILWNVEPSVKKIKRFTTWIVESS
jgi:hypothetical protein